MCMCTGEGCAHLHNRCHIGNCERSRAEFRNLGRLGFYELSEVKRFSERLNSMDLYTGRLLVCRCLGRLGTTESSVLSDIGFFYVMFTHKT